MLDWISRDQPAPAPDMPPQLPAVGDEVDHPSYEDPRDMPVDDEDMPPPQGTRPEPDLDDDPPSQPPGGSAQVPVPGGEHDDSEPDAPLDPDDNGGGQPPGGGPQGPGTLRSRGSVFVGFSMHRGIRSIVRSIKSCVFRSCETLSYRGILRMLMRLTRRSILLTDHCLVASTGFSRGRNSGMLSVLSFGISIRGPSRWSLQRVEQVVSTDAQ